MEKEAKSISYIEDIIKEVSEEQDIPFRELMAVYDNFIRYIRYTMDQDDTYSFTFPYIGTVHLNTHLLKKSIKKREQYKAAGFNIDEKQHQHNIDKLERLEEFKQERIDSPARGRETHGKQPILWKIRKKAKHKYTFEEIEDISKTQQK